MRSLVSHRRDRQWGSMVWRGGPKERWFCCLLETALSSQVDDTGVWRGETREKGAGKRSPVSGWVDLHLQGCVRWGRCKRDGSSSCVCWLIYNEGRWDRVDEKSQFVWMYRIGS